MGDTSSVAAFMGMTPVPEVPKWERKAAMDAKLAYARE